MRVKGIGKHPLPLIPLTFRRVAFPCFLGRVGERRRFVVELRLSSIRFPIRGSGETTKCECGPVEIRGARRSRRFAIQKFKAVFEDRTSSID
jgi:hypothetical protein